MKRAQGRSGCTPHPRSHVPLCIKRNVAHEHTGSAEASGLPCAMALRLIRALPGDPAFLSPSPAGLTANLTPTLGRQDHTLLPYASSRIVTRKPASTAARPDVS